MLRSRARGGVKCARDSLTLRAVHLEVSPLLPPLLLVVLMAGSVVPASPMRLGVFHYSCVLTLSMFGVEPDQVYYSDEEVTLDRTMGIVFWSKMTERGIIIMPDARWYVSAVVTDEDIDRSLEAANEVLGEMV